MPGHSARLDWCLPCRDRGDSRTDGHRLNGNLLYGFSHYDSGRIFCLDSRTGEIRWQGPPRTGENVAFLSIPGHIVALINDGRLQIIQADSDRYELAATYPVSEEETWAPPVMLPDGILVKDQQTLRRYSF